MEDNPGARQKKVPAWVSVGSGLVPVRDPICYGRGTLLIIHVDELSVESLKASDVYALDDGQVSEERLLQPLW